MSLKTVDALGRRPRTEHRVVRGSDGKRGTLLFDSETTGHASFVEPLLRKENEPYKYIMTGSRPARQLPPPASTAWVQVAPITSRTSSNPKLGRNPVLMSPALRPRLFFGTCRLCRRISLGLPSTSWHGARESKDVTIGTGEGRKRGQEPARRLRATLNLKRVAFGRPWGGLVRDVMVCAMARGGVKKYSIAAPIKAHAMSREHPKP